MRCLWLAIGALLLMSGIGSAAGAPPRFVVVVHHSNPTINLPLADLRAYFGGILRSWPSGAKVVLVERETESDALRFLLQRVLKTSLTEYKRSLMGVEFRGEAPVTLKVLNSDAAACKFVFNVPGSIALIGADALSAPECSGVRAVSIEGKRPGDEGYKLQ